MQGMPIPAKIDFSSLEEDIKFRADLLFYLHQANAYIATIFWHGFGNGKTITQMRSLVRELEQQRDKRLEGGLRKSLFTKEGRKNMDVFKDDFITVLESLPQSRKDAFAQKLRLDHAIPLNFKDFTNLVDDLKEKRHFLEHFEDRRHRPRLDDKQFYKALGLLLLPSLHGMVLGSVASAMRRTHARNDASLETVRQILRGSHEDRKQGARDLALHRKKENMQRWRRQAEEQKETKWHGLYDIYFPDGHFPRYNHSNFKLRYFFIGAPKIRRIMTELDQVYSPQTPHFRNEIEAVYDTTLRINLLIWAFLQKSPLKQKKWPNALKPLRNHIAHNDFFWTLPAAQQDQPDKIVSPKQVFRLLFDFSKKDPNGYKRALHLRDDVKSILKKQDFAYAYPLFDPASGESIAELTETPNRQASPVKVKYWSTVNRKTFSNKTRYRLDKRLRVRRLMGLWSARLDTAWMDWKNAEQK